MGAHQVQTKDTLNVEIPLKTKSIAPYETDIPVKTGALESLFKMSKNGKVKPLLVKIIIKYLTIN